MGVAHAGERVGSRELVMTGDEVVSQSAQVIDELARSADAPQARDGRNVTASTQPLRETD